jgi:hypothetical protein
VPSARTARDADHVLSGAFRDTLLERFEGPFRTAVIAGM